MPLSNRVRIEAELDRPVRHLSDLVGGPGSAGVLEFALPRVSVDGCHPSRAVLAGFPSGVPFLAWNRGRRLYVARAGQRRRRWR